MPNVCVSVPTARVPDLVAMAEAYMTERRIDYTGMTSLQKGQRFLTEITKERFIEWRRQQAEVTAEQTAQASIATAVTTAKTDADTIIPA